MGEIRRHKTGAVLIASLALGLVAAVAYGVYRLAHTPTVGRPQMKILRLTTGGRVGNAVIDGGISISADGKYVTFATSEEGKQALWVKQVSTGSLVQIVPPVEANLNGGTTFSPDGEFVYFNRGDSEDRMGALYRVPVLGGIPQKVLSGVGGSVTFSPDGKEIAFVRWDLNYGSYLMVAKLDGTGERKLGSRVLPQYFSWGGLDWSPDGKTIACLVGHIDDFGQLIGVSVKDGSERTLTSQKFGDVGRVLWLRDSSGLVLSAEPGPFAGGTQIFFVSYPSGEMSRITTDLNNHGRELAVTGDGKTIVTAQVESSAQIYTINKTEDFDKLASISTGKYDGILGLSWTPDGRLTFVAQAGESVDIWSMNADGKNQKQLTFDGLWKQGPSATSDGRYIVFTAGGGSDRLHVARMDIDGRNVKQLAGNCVCEYTVASPDGAWVLFNSIQTGKPRVWRVGIDGGEALQLSDDLSNGFAISPDGKSIAYFGVDQNHRDILAVMPFEGGQPTKSIEFPASLTPKLDAPLRWTADGSALTFVDQLSAGDNIWMQPIKGGPPKRITNFKSDRIFAFDWSRDGKQLAVSHGPTLTDVILIKDFK